MLKWRILLVLVLACSTMPESMRLVAFLCHAGLAPISQQDSSVPCPDLPAPCDGEEGKWVTADSVDDHDGSFFWILDLDLSWPPTQSARTSGSYATSHDFFDSLHRLRI